MALGTEIREIPEDVMDFTKSQIDKRNRNQPIGGPEWSMNLRLADELYPGYKT